MAAPFFLDNGEHKKRVQSDMGLFFFARLEGFEPPAYGLEVRCSIQLSYRRICERCIETESRRAVSQGSLLI